MTAALVRRPAARFAVWAAILIAAAVATGTAGLVWWLIAVVEFGAWAAVTAAERVVWRLGREQTRARRRERPAPAGPEPSAARKPEPVPEPVPEAAIAFAGAYRDERPAMAAGPGETMRWNVWSLERLARGHPREEELEFLVASLRDFADADGQLPGDFDALVRESFGDVLTD